MVLLFFIEGVRMPVVIMCPWMSSLLSLVSFLEHIIDIISIQINLPLWYIWAQRIKLCFPEAPKIICVLILDKGTTFCNFTGLY